MEHVVADAISACVPSGVLRTTMQPSTERCPVDHAERCAAEGLDPSAVRRADIAVEFLGPRRLVIDVATTNVVSDSALSKSVRTHMESIESTKDRTYKAYYGEFHPLVVSLGGGVTERGWGLIKRICCEAARLSRPRLPWEPYEWAVRALQHITAGMARVMGWIATRMPADAPGASMACAAADAATSRAWPPLEAEVIGDVAHTAPASSAGGGLPGVHRPGALAVSCVPPITGDGAVAPA